MRWRGRPKRAPSALFPELDRDFKVARSVGLPSSGQLYDLPLEDQEEALRHYELTISTCRHCNRPVSECSDPNRQWYAQRSICFATLARVMAERMYAGLHRDAPFHDGTFQSWRKEWTADHPLQYDDAVDIWVDSVDRDPDDAFMSEPEAQPASLRAAKQADDQRDEPGHEAERTGGA